MYNSSIICFHKDLNLDKDYYIGLENQPIINASIGTSLVADSFETELDKAIVAVTAGANMVTDHSITGDVENFHKRLRAKIHVPLCCVPIYGLSVNDPFFSEEMLFDYLQRLLDRGFNTIAIHATVRRSDLAHPISANRVIPITSKGGRQVLKWMQNTGKENPFYTLFPNILNLVKRYNAAISLAPTYRPASVLDNSFDEDDSYWIEVGRMAELVKEAIGLEVPIIVEGIGHAMISRIPEYVKRTKAKCFGVPYKVLAVSTDVALGYDNISSAIASCVAVMNGANVVTAVTSAEHISLPNVKQVEEAVVSAKIAIHSARLCFDESIELDRRMSMVRNTKKSCQGSINEALYPLGAQKALKDNLFNNGCSMCGKLCAFVEEES